MRIYQRVLLVGLSFFLLTGCEDEWGKEVERQAEQKRNREMRLEAVLPIFHSYYKYVQHDPGIREHLSAGIDENGRLRKDFGKHDDKERNALLEIEILTDPRRFKDLRDFNGEPLTYKIYEADFDYYQDLESKYPEKVAALYEK